MKLSWVLTAVVSFLSVSLLFSDSGGQTKREADLRNLNQSHSLRYLGGNMYIDDLTGEEIVAPPIFHDLLDPGLSGSKKQR